MVNNRRFIKNHPRTFHNFLRGRVYSASSPLPSFLPIYTRSASANPNDSRFPCVESVMDGLGFQPHVHDITVTLKHGRATSTFRIFFKRHIRLPHNAALDIQGDLVVMRSAHKNPESVVNTRSSDRRLIDLTVHHIAPTLKTLQQIEGCVYRENWL
ncbi:hypothetical protein B0H11DRAFT_2282216 [Mycena galericulata]|nr:hypothetical protein B0H11DRAFT_2282216 [Mycena galericulata]